MGGLFGRVASGVVGNETVTNKVSLTLQTFNGVQLSKRLAVGALIGVDWYKAALLMPVGAGVRYQVTRPDNKNVSVFLSGDAGYGLPWLNKSSTGYAVKGGLMLNPGIGVRLGKPNAAGFTISVGYKRQLAQVEKPLRWNELIRDESRIYNRLALRIGTSF
ncbi:MAG: hypothetical protein EAZ91_00545 [Cytophagales bacterium]|nr:MAG: hypothetical protein EAZ91_00545 [Cytophagales bacterium]